ncbi:hypothetical protein Pint_30552 [Pistacia integerrima]|uniref:Uncharacterized protein n=1 Tax=Pistacia integerrima TaxID=434235 RepID=A0ACC0X160_9ROSI|nr:hypothetical protein Pint_30552 [Pistacia integerrima]
MHGLLSLSITTLDNGYLGPLRLANEQKCDTWCELQNLVNHRVFECKLRLKPLGRGHIYLGVMHRCPPPKSYNLAAPQLRRDYQLSLSISISEGKETYQDSLSNSE